jgi:SOS-response transcriptional repressor LexA
MAAPASVRLTYFREEGMEKLSSRQQEVYNIIDKYFVEHGYCPSLADIAREVGLHESTIATYTGILKQKGYLTSDYRVARSLRIVKQKEK